LRTIASDGESTSTATDNALFPWQHTRQVSQGPSQSTTSYTFTSGGDSASFHVGFHHQRAGQAGNAAVSHGFFTVVPLEDMWYQISGGYQSAGGGTTGLELSLHTGVTDLFRNVQRSVSASDHAFVVGQQGGTEPALLEGSLTGTLTAFENYLFSYRLEVQESGGIMAATGTGGVFLHLSPVPEPATAMLIALLAPWMITRRRRSHACVA